MLISFDLDGTLINSAEDLAVSVNAMLEHMGREQLPHKVIQNYVGNGAQVLVRRALGEQSSEQECEAGLSFFLSYYRQHSLEHTRLYAGVRELLDELHTMQHTLAVLTNKPVKISRDILRALDVYDLFFRVYGGDSFAQKKPDPMGLQALISESAASDGDVLVVGDSPVDVQTARNAGVKCCGVLWGFQPQMLAASGADMLIGQPHQLLAYVERPGI